MDILRQTELRSNIKKYFEIVSKGGAYIIPQKKEQDIVIISQDEYQRLLRYKEYAEAIINKGKAKSIPGVDISGLLSSAADDWSGLMELVSVPVDDPMFLRYDTELPQIREEL